MTLKELDELLQKVKLPVAYLAFPAAQAPSMPFIIYQETGSDNFGADNKVWHTCMKVQIDLFTKKKDRDLEERLETVLQSKSIYWERESFYENEEKCYRITYDIELVGEVDEGSHDYDPYPGPYEVIPKTYVQTLDTKDKDMENDVTVFEIPYAEVSNEYGTTVNIAYL